MPGGVEKIMRRVLFWAGFLSAATIVLVLLFMRPDAGPEIQLSLSGDHLRIQRVLVLLNRYAADSERMDRKPVYPARLLDLVPDYLSEDDYKRDNLAALRYNPIPARTAQRVTELIFLRKGTIEISGLENATIIEIDAENK